MTVDELKNISQIESLYFNPEENKLQINGEDVTSEHQVSLIVRTEKRKIQLEINKLECTKLTFNLKTGQRQEGQDA